MSQEAKHIEKDKLYSDLLYRFQYVSEFADFNEQDINAIKASAPLVAPLVPAIVNATYEKLFKFDISKQFFLPKNDDFQGKVVSDMKELHTETEQIKYRKDMLSKYLVKLVTAEYDEIFVKYLDRVARVHTLSSGRKNPVQIDQIHINALFGWLHGFLVSALDAHPDLQSAEAQPTRTKTLAAFSKLLWIQNDFFLKYNSPKPE